jgi:hypothetical protein
VIKALPIARGVTIIALAVLLALLAIAGPALAQDSLGQSAAASQEPKPAPEQVITSEQILSMIKSGEQVSYHNVTITGYLDLSALTDPVEQPISITGSSIQGLANFEGVTFQQPVSFSGTEFVNSTSFRKARFLEDVSFERAKFSGQTDFRESRFNGMAAFTMAEFRKEVSFASARFGGDTIFLGAKFIENASFDFAQFSQLVSFYGAQFSRVTGFTNSQFDGISNFGSTKFLGNTSFAATSFNGDVIFRAAQFSNGTTFGLASFAGFADFASVDFKVVAFFGLAKFSDNAHFTEANFEKGLILEGSRFYSMQLENANFGPGARLNLNNSDFSKFMVRWDTIKDLLVFNGAAYLALVKNYKNLEWFDDADNCYYQYRRISQEQEPWGWTKFVDIIAWASAGYGVRVSYTIFWCIFTIIFFGVALYVGNGMRKFEFEGLEIAGGSAKVVPGNRVSLIDAMYFSTAMFTTSQAPVNTYPVGFYRHMAMLEGILGWFFLGLFVVVLSGMLIR